MNKRIFAMFLALVMALSVMPFSAFAAGFGLSQKPVTNPPKVENSEASDTKNDNATADTDVLPCGHKKVVLVVKKATCTADGYIHYDCDKHCGKSLVKVDLPAGHDFTEEVPAKEATCTEGGYTTHKKCACGETTTYFTTAPKEHTYVNGKCSCGAFKFTTDKADQEDSKPDDSENDDSTADTSVLPCGHKKVVLTDKKPTCKEDGYVVYDCDKHCGKSFNRVEIPAADHDYTIDVPAKEATCTEGGYTAHKKCACGETTTYFTTAPKDHTYVNGRCSCGAVQISSDKADQDDSEKDDTTEDTSVLACGHKRVVLTDKKPTCTEDGYVVYDCDKHCGKSFKRIELPATKHNYSVDVPAKEATCTEGGYTAHKKCACGETTDYFTTAPKKHTYVNGKCVCGAMESTADEDDSKNDDTTADTALLPCGHTYVELYRKDPTCLEAGYVDQDCNMHCGKSFKRVVLAATGHRYTTEVAGKDATCTEDGYGSHAQCACGAKTLHIVIRAKGHNYVNGKCACGKDASSDDTAILACGHKYFELYRKNPTCTEAGYVDHDCDKHCGKSFSREVLEATGHNYASEIANKDATCTEAGHTSYELCACGAKTLHAVIPATGHKFVNGKCACGEVEDKDTLACGHKYVELYRKNPTCTEDGYVDHDCNMHCGKSFKRETLKATGHKYTVEVAGKAPTCTEGGYAAHKKCGVCGEHEVHLVTSPNGNGHNFVNGICEKCGRAPDCLSEKGHNWLVSTVKEATCTEAGKQHYACSRCKNSYDAEIPATGHKFVNGKCACGEVEDKDTLACGHKYVELFRKNPTCTEDGYVDHDCNMHCGKSFKREVLKATGHKYTTEVAGKAATCTEAGYTSYTQCACGAKTVHALIPATGHNYVNGMCKDCGRAPGCLSEKGHNWLVTTVKEATCTEAGKQHYACSRCKNTYDAEIPATGHNYVNGSCQCGAVDPNTPATPDKNENAMGTFFTFDFLPVFIVSNS